MNLDIGLLERAIQPFRRSQAWRACSKCFERDLHCHRARDLAALVPAHTVRHHKDHCAVVLDQMAARVFIAFALGAHIGQQR